MTDMVLNNTPSFSGHSQTPSDDVTAMFLTVNVVYLNVAFAVFGIGSNTINIVVFVKQGFHDNVNISLFALAVADLGSLVSALLFSLCENPAFADTISPLDATDFNYLFAVFPRGTLGRITSCITAFITFERCMCVVVPFKVKRMITARVTVIAMVIIYASLAATLIPVYLLLSLDWRFDFVKNKTILGIVPTGYTGPADINLAMSVHTVVQMVSFSASILFTAIIIIEIRNNYKWRKARTTSDVNTTKLNDKKVAKTVGMIATMASVYVVCYTPSIAVLATGMVEPNFSNFGYLQNSFLVVVSFNIILESVNSSVGVFLYYNMSVKFRKTFRKTFKFGGERGNK